MIGVNIKYLKKRFLLGFTDSTEVEAASPQMMHPDTVHCTLYTVATLNKHCYRKYITTHPSHITPISETIYCQNTANIPPTYRQHTANIPQYPDIYHQPLSWYTTHQIFNSLTLRGSMTLSTSILFDLQSCQIVKHMKQGLYIVWWAAQPPLRLT